MSLPLAALLAASAFAPRVFAQDAEPAPTHAIPLRVVIFEGSGWTRPEVEGRLARVWDVVDRCGVRLAPVTVVELAPPSGTPSPVYARDRSGEPDGLGSVARAAGAGAGPTLFYIADFADRPQPGTSRPRHQVGAAPEADTAWITRAVLSEGHGDAYSVDAHELVHVLADIGHWAPEDPPGTPPRRKGDPGPRRDAGLMAGSPNARSDRLDPSLCARIKSHPSARALSGRVSDTEVR